MLTIDELITLPGLRMLDVRQELGQETVDISASVLSKSACCPNCQTESHAVHSRYERVKKFFVPFIALWKFVTTQGWSQAGRAVARTGRNG